MSPSSRRLPGRRVRKVLYARNVPAVNDAFSRVKPIFGLTFPEDGYIITELGAGMSRAAWVRNLEMTINLRDEIRKELNYSADSKYAAELIEAGMTIYTVDAAKIAYDLSECDWPYVVGLDRPFNSAEFVPHIEEWQRDHRRS